MRGALKEKNLCAEQLLSLLYLRLVNFGDERGNDLKQVADNRIVRHVKDGGILVLIDGDDGL